MKIAVYASGEKALLSLESLTDELVNAIGIVIIGTDPKVQHDFSDEIRAFCEKRDLRHSFDDTILDGIEALIAIGWRRLIQKNPNQQLIVLHDSILPRYRGFNPLVTALINGDTEIGVTALFGEESYDTGSIIGVETIKISYPIRITEAIKKISGCYALLLRRVVKGLIDDTLTAVPQDHQKATYSLWRDREDYFIDWNSSSEKILRKIHAVGFPYDGAKFRLKDQIYTITEATVIPDVVVENRDVGKVIFKKDGNPVVVCGKGLLRLDTVVDKDGNPERFENKFRLRFT